MDTRKVDVIIIGAGLTGLTMAFYLKKSGKKVLVIEKADKVGGVIETVSEQGFIYETGPNTGVLSTPELVELFADMDDHCTLETANPKAHKRYILKNGKWHALPAGLVSAVKTPLFSLKDKFRILAEPLRKPGNNPDESIAGLVMRRMGRSFLDYAVDPFISGIYAGNPEKLVTRYALPKLYALEQNYGSFIKGSIKKKGEVKTELEKKATREVFSVKDGLGNLTNAIAEKIGSENIILDALETRVEIANSEFVVSYAGSNGSRLRANAPVVVSTIGSYELPTLLPFISENSLKPITCLEYAGVVQVALGYKNWEGSDLDAFGGLVPSKEKRGVLGILFLSAIFTGRAPEKGALLSVFLGGVKNPGAISKSDDEIKALVLNEVEDTLFQKSQPDLFRVFRYSKAIPQYEKSTGERLECIKSLEAKYPGLVLAGNIRDGIGMADRVKQAKQIADFLIQGK